MGLKRDSKGNLAEITPLRSRKGSIYQKGSNEVFKISRSKFSSFLDCKRCFYLDRVKGLKDPGMPGWSLNVAVDELLKKEFDLLRNQKKPHPIFKKYNLNFIPFQHNKMNHWRNSLIGGVSYLDQDTNLEIHGGVDDIWQDTRDDRLVIADYKSQANNRSLEAKTYLEDPYHQGYKIQMDFYGYLLSEMGFKVSEMSYFLVCNADRNAAQFAGKLSFREVMIPYRWNSGWIPQKISEMIDLLNSDNIPEGHFSCKNCAYAKQRAIFE